MEPVTDDRTVVDFSSARYLGSGYGMGRTAFAGGNQQTAETVIAEHNDFYRRLREDDPVRPSNRCRQLGGNAATVRALRGDLDWIVMRALEKKRDRRYGSA